MANIYTDLLKLRMPALGDPGWDDELNDNAQILELVAGQILKGNHVIYGCAPTDGGGLQVDYAAGKAEVGKTKYTISQGNKACTAQVKNWLYINNAGTVVISTIMPTGDYALLAMIDTSVDDILRVADLRGGPTSYRGIGTFVGQSGTSIDITSLSLGVTDYHVVITPHALSGDIGEISVESKAANSFVVKNSGSNNSIGFDWLLKL